MEINFSRYRELSWLWGLFAARHTCCFWLRLYSWMIAWISNPALVAGAVGYLSTLVSFDKSIALFIEIGILVSITAFNLFSIRVAGSGELIITTLKVIPLILLPLIGIFYIDLANFEHFNTSGKSFTSALNTVAFLTLWGFIGLETGTVPGNKVLNARRNIPVATILGTAIAAVIYILGTIVIIGVLPNETLINSKGPYADVASAIFGGSWGTPFAIAAIISCIGTLNGWTMVVGRMPQAAADEGLFPKIFSKTNRFGTPYLGIIISSILTIPLLIMSISDNLIDQFNFIIEVSTTLILFIYFVCVLAYFKIILLNKGFSPLNILIGAGALCFNCWALWAVSANMLMLSFVIVISGIPMYLWMRKKFLSI
jgi:APA family basic amino acid/polyamine antiporter